MGTRGAWGFFYKDETLVTYNHFDSYPAQLGQVIKDFAIKNTKEAMINIAKNLVMVKESDKPSDEEISLLGKYYNENVNGGSLKDYYALLRETQGNPWCYVEDSGLNVMIDSHKFLRDSLFCEWAYIINLDDDVLEIYRGFVKEPPENSRYYSRLLSFPNLRGGYFPVDMVQSVPFETLNEFDMVEFEESFND